MENFNLIVKLIVILLVPLLPAFIIFKFLPPSKNVVKGPFKGLNINLTGAFSGYFLLVLISLTLTFSTVRSNINENIENLKVTSNATIDSLKALNAGLTNQIKTLNANITEQTNKYKSWTIIAKLDSGIQYPAGTKMFVSQGNGNYANQFGEFEAHYILENPRYEIKNEFPDEVCFYNPDDGYYAIDLNKNKDVKISSERRLEITKPIKLSFKKRPIANSTRY